ncbi:MAG: hypothetical protein ACRDMV_02330 [Streptosporangiales bacterium]
MTWFKVSDDLHSHPKAMAAGVAAVGLWTLAGSWSSDAGKGGFVPDYLISRLAEDGPQLARKLVAAGLWTRVKSGYQFHDWDERNPSETAARAIRSDRRRAALVANHERWHVKRGITDPECEHCP